MNSETPDREELRRRLRSKIRGKRSNDHTGPQLAQRLQDDPATALMSMGIDDASVLNNAKQIIQMSKSMLNNSAKKVAKEETTPKNNKIEKKNTEDDDDSEEEAPPPPTS
jgi:hypothetical protein